MSGSRDLSGVQNHFTMTIKAHVVERWMGGWETDQIMVGSCRLDIWGLQTGHMCTFQKLKKFLGNKSTSTEKQKAEHENWDKRF